MSVRAEGATAPLRRSEKKRIEEISKRIEQLVQDGMPRYLAEMEAQQEARDNNTMHWRK